MPNIKILKEAELRELMPLDIKAIDCIENAFAALSQEGVIMPPILSMGIHQFNGEVDVKTAYVPSIESFAIKMSPGFFDNPKLGLPSTSGLMVLFSSKTGTLEALLLDNGYLTDLRTAAAGAVAARHLSPIGVKTACVVGCGNQAILQLKALNLVRPLKSAEIWGRDNSKAKATAELLSNDMKIEVVATEDRSKMIEQSEVIITATPSNKPLIKAEWLRPGHHITAMGSDQAHKCELEPACLKVADIYVPDYQDQTKILGELHHALVAGLVDKEKNFPDLGAVVSGKSRGRTNADQITIADLTGTGIQDTAIATLSRQKAENKKLGSIFEN